MTAGTKAAKILVVDDDGDIRAAMTQALELEGYKVVTATDGREGMEALESHHPELILLDLMMPHMDGSQFKEAISQNPKLSGIPIVLLSSDHNIKETSENLGIPHFLSKPFQLDSLLTTVKSLI